MKIFPRSILGHLNYQAEQFPIFLVLDRHILRNLFGLGSVTTFHSLRHSPLVFFRHGATGTPLGSESWRMWSLGDENIFWKWAFQTKTSNIQIVSPSTKENNYRTNSTFGMIFLIMISQLLFRWAVWTPLASKLLETMSGIWGTTGPKMTPCGRPCLFLSLWPSWQYSD